VQPAGDLVPGSAQVMVAPGPHLEHGRVILGPHHAAGRRAQRRDRDGPGVAGVVLARRPGRQQPHPGTQLRLHVQDMPARGDELPGQQVAQAGGALDCPGPFRPGRGPRHEPLGLRCRGTHPQLAQRLPGRADRHRGVRCLVRIDTDHHCCHQSLLRHPARGERTAAGMPDSGSTGVRASCEPRHGETRGAGRSFVSQAVTGRQAVTEPAPRASRRYGQTANAYADSSIRRLRARLSRRLSCR